MVGEDQGGVSKSGGAPVAATMTAGLAEAIVAGASDAIIACDRGNRIVVWNRAAEKLYGYAAAEVLGKHAHVLAPPELAGDLDARLARVLGGETVAPFDAVQLGKDGARLDVSGLGYAGGTGAHLAGFAPAWVDGRLAAAERLSRSTPVDRQFEGHSSRPGIIARRRKNDHLRSDSDSLIKVFDILIQQSDAAR